MDRQIGKMEKGIITVEATLCLVPFIMVIVGIVSFINIYLVHNRIQYAIFQVGSELSAYTYLYEALGLRAADQTLQADADKATQDVDKVIALTNEFISNTMGAKESYAKLSGSDISNIRENLEESMGKSKEVVESGKEVGKQVVHMVNHPETIVQGAVYMGIEKLMDVIKGGLAGALSSGLANIYIQQLDRTADQYLQAFNVKEGKLNYGNSTMFSDEDHRMIDIVVEYDIEVYFFKLFLKDPTIHMVQRVTVPAWLDGDGSSYE